MTISTPDPIQLVQSIVYKKTHHSFFEAAIVHGVSGILNTLPIHSFLKPIPRYRNYMMTEESLLNIYFYLYRTFERGVPGDVVEFGCHEGLTAILLSKTMHEYPRRRKLTVYDTFGGLTAPTKGDQGTYLSEGDCSASADRLRKNFREFHEPLPQMVIGDVTKTIPSKLPKTIAFAHLDMDLYEPTLHTLLSIYPRLDKRSVVILDDYGNPSIPGVERAVNDLQKKHRLKVNVIPLSAGAYPYCHFVIVPRMHLGKYLQNIRQSSPNEKTNCICSCNAL